MMKHMFTLDEAANAAEGRIVSRAAAENSVVTIDGVSKDTRTIRPGDIYVAIKGENFDGHDYCISAVAKGASCLLVEREEAIPEGAVGIVVDDSVKALGKLASLYRFKLGAKTICVTGSVGKTTTREMIACALSSTLKVHSTKSNQNNEIGLPMTILEAPSDTQVLVLEMGMRGRGEISYLTRIACPDIAIITNVGYSHIERLGSREEIRLAKTEIIEGLTEGGILAVNGDDSFLCEYASNIIPVGKLFASAHVKLGSREIVRPANCMITAVAENVRTTDGGMVFDIKETLNDVEIKLTDVKIKLNGVHNVRNSVFALLCAGLLAADCQAAADALASYGEMEGRGAVKDNGRNIIINDAYNASPESMEAAYANLALLGSGRRKIAALGCMLELGTYAPMLHEQIGRNCGSYGFELTLITGDNKEDFLRGFRQTCPDGKILLCENTDEVREKLKEELAEGDIVLFKASNAFGFQGLAKEFAAGGYC